MNENILMNCQLNNKDYSDKRRTTALVLDVETSLSESNEKVLFDIGWTISEVQNEEMVIHRSFLVEEIFLNMDIMKRAHYFNKYPKYIKALASGLINLAPWGEIIRTLNEDIIKFNVKHLYAYNAGFDKTSITTTNRFINPLNELVYDMRCLWSAMTTTHLDTKKYILTAVANRWYNPTTGNIFTGAEYAYRFISQDFEFVEDHTGLEDSIIETKLLWEVNKSNKKKQWDINPQTWKVVQETKNKLGITIELEPKQPQEPKKVEWLHVDRIKTEVIETDTKIINITVQEKE